MRLALLALLALSAAAAQPQPLVRNGSFEELDQDGAPAGWSRVVWGVDGVDGAAICTTPEVGDAPDGRRIARTKADRALYSAWAQELEGLEPGRWYEVSAMVRSQDLKGQGCHLNLEFWLGPLGLGCVDAEHLVGTTEWTRQVVRFQAPGPGQTCKLSLFQIGGPGEAFFDDLQLRPIDMPKPDLSRRRVLDRPFWGMFTCFARYLHMYGDTMRDAGVHWQRQGMSALAPEQQQVAERLGMEYEMCIDGMPGATDPADPCYPVTNSRDYLEWLKPALESAGKSIVAWEFFNEPNTNLAWTLPGYSELIRIVGKAIKARHPEALIATGGFALPGIGYAEACLKRDTDRVIDLVLLHPYAMDEALDSELQGVADACERAGRPDVAVAINETGWATWDPATGHANYELFVSEKLQAQAIVKLHIQSLAHRISFVTLLAWNDITEPSDHAKNMGLIRVDGSAKPSLGAYRFMTSTIGDRREVEWSYAPDGTRVYRFDGERPVWVVWNALRGTETTLDVGETRVFVWDMYGTRLTATPRSGRVTVQASGEPVYVVSAEP